MDSVTQFALGSVIGVATLGRRIGPRKAAITGGLVATLPDMDVFLPAADPVTAFVTHRGFSHSLIVHSVAAPLLGLGIGRLFTGLRDAPRWLPIGAVWLMLVTHALLDAFTVYGTKLLWPLTDYPFGLGSVFIIDPLYTLPLLAVTLWALLQGDWGRRIGRAASIGIVVSSMYLGWSVLAQQLMRDKIAAVLEGQGVTAEKLLVTPMPFNTVLWKGIALDGDRYVNVYSSLFDGPDARDIHVHARQLSLAAALPDTGAVDAVARFSKGFYALSFADLGDGNGDILLRDLRMGATPNYVFTFKIAKSEAGAVRPSGPVKLNRVVEEGALPWLWTRIFDQQATRKETSLHHAYIGQGEGENRAVAQ
ncbi:metal-dependent hydrolase [Hwanghaeella sp.]|uniref:metal-dependent hydrolase n=1 Tax=Hwanghaeella sp. TaxID=2605943 RepID=UPI003CCBA7FE